MSRTVLFTCLALLLLSLIRFLPPMPIAHAATLDFAPAVSLNAALGFTTGTRPVKGTTRSSGAPTTTGGSLRSGDRTPWSQTQDARNEGAGRRVSPIEAVNDGRGRNNGAVTLIVDRATEGDCVASIVVTKDADDGSDGTLRNAIANVCAGGTITFDADYTITLGSQLTIDKSLTIDGETHQITVSGNNVTRVFNVAAGNVTFQSLTIADGNVQTNDCGSYSDRCGGGIILQNSGVVVNVLNSTLSGNSASSGGGIDNERGTLNIVNSTLSGNSATGTPGTGGGIYSEAGTVNVTNSTFSNNSATKGVASTTVCTAQSM